MKIEIKCLEGNKWNHMPIEKVKGSSLIDFMLDELSPTVAAVYDNDKPVFFVSNTDNHRDLMVKKGHHCFTAQEFSALMGAEKEIRPMIAYTFPGSEILDIRRAEQQESLL